MKEIKTKQELDEILGSSSKNILLKVGAPWCNPCRILGRTLLDIEGGYTNDYIFLETDGELADDQLIGSLSIFNLPTIVIFKNGEELYRRSGLLTREQLTNLLNELKDK